MQLSTLTLDPGVRHAVPYLQLATVAFESDVKFWGAELVLSGPKDEPQNGSSFGAANLLEHLNVNS